MHGSFLDAELDAHHAEGGRYDATPGTGCRSRMKKAVFLDRDDTLMAANVLPPPPPPGARGDVVDPSLVRLLPGAAEACARLKRAGFTLVVVSNQGLVARGAGTIGTVHRVNRRLEESLGPGVIDAFYFCPFHPKGQTAGYSTEHSWRKPGGGMLSAAARELGVDLAVSWLIGDAARDVDAGIAAGLRAERCLLLGPGMSIVEAADRIVGSV
jgi:D-glycero-D-manno-heptose 1,7-bisphosphate phosphatase